MLFYISKALDKVSINSQFDNRILLNHITIVTNGYGKFSLYIYIKKVANSFCLLQKFFPKLSGGKNNFSKGHTKFWCNTWLVLLLRLMKNPATFRSYTLFPHARQCAFSITKDIISLFRIWNQFKSFYLIYIFLNT